MAILDKADVDQFWKKKPNLRKRLLCFLGFHDWLYAPHSIEISTRYICLHCQRWKDYNGKVFKDTGRRYGWKVETGTEDDYKEAARIIKRQVKKEV